MVDFEQLVKERRSAMKFIPDVELPDADLEEIFKLVKFTPSAFNLQHTHYVVVKDRGLIEQIYKAANNQYKIKTASAVILALGNMDAHLDVARINEGFLNLGIMSKQEYDMEVESVLSFYEGRGEAFKRDDAIRNASLSAQMFMLVAKARGWDTCPMIGFDPETIATILNIPERHVTAMMIAIGKEDTTKLRPRGYRKPVGEFVSYEQFT